MELIKPDINIDFVRMRFKAFALSAILILLGLAVLAWRGGLNLGVDFSGGTLIQVQFEQPARPDEIRKALKDIASNSTIQQIGSAEDNEFLIRTEAVTSELQSLAKTVEADLSEVYGQGQVSVRRVEMVGPKVGHDLRQKALFAIYYALLLIAIYISGRFELKWAISAIMAGGLILGIYMLQAIGLSVVYLIVGALIITLALCWKLKLPYALGAVIALLHDVLVTVGIFALANKEFTLEVLAAVLTLVGFSLNDTIIIYDRIRENLKKGRRQDLKEVINRSINQTLSRTILTSGTVLFVVLCLFLWGGSVIHDFSFALLIGLITGVYSTIYIANPVLILYEDWTRSAAPRRVQKGKEAAS